MKVQIKNAKLGFADIFDAKTSEFSDKAKYSAQFIVTDETKMIINGEEKTAEEIVALMQKVITDKFGAKAGKVKNWAFCRGDGEGCARDEFTNNDGEFYFDTDADTVRFVATKQPHTCRASWANDKGKLMLILADKSRAVSGDINSGDIVNGFVDLFATDAGGSKSINASIGAIQLVESRGGGGSQVIDENEFDDLSGGAGTEEVEAPF